MSVRSCRKAAVSLLFAIALVPLLMLVGLAIDFGFYNEAQSQLNMAADASALHAARVAAQLQQAKDPAYLEKARKAGDAWFTAQEGAVPQARAGSVTPVVKVTYDPTTKLISAQVTFTGVIVTHFAGLFPASWPQYPNWGIAGAATAVISVPNFNEMDILADNSNSMLIAADDKSIRLMEALTPCSNVAANEDQAFDGSYSWAYTATGGQYVSNPPQSAYSSTPAPGGNPGVYVPYGYGTFFYAQKGTGINNVAAVVLHTQEIVPLQAPVVGQCDYRFDGSALECEYPGTLLGTQVNTATGTSTYGQCKAGNNAGGPGSLVPYPGLSVPNGFPAIPNMPQAPCAFACHNKQGADYYALSQQNPQIKLRYTVLQQTIGNLITKIESNQTQLTVGVYQFNAPNTANSQPQGIVQVYPEGANLSNPFSDIGEAGPANAQAANDASSIEPPLVGNVPDTNFENAMNLLTGYLTPGGSGLTPSSPQKELVIVTDGLDDYIDAQGNRIEQSIDPGACAALKAKNYSIYVLYTVYKPLPNPYYLNNSKVWAEPSVPGTDSPVAAALKQCSSGPKYFFEATDNIPTQLNNILQAITGSSGRLSQ